MRRQMLAPVLLGVLLIFGWGLSAGAGSVLLPTPGSVAARLASDLADPTYWSYLGVTLAEAFGGGLLGTAVALPPAGHARKPPSEMSMVYFGLPNSPARTSAWVFRK